ncbi:MAG: hypothetical protein QGG42_08760 [Phycisphaerae bacterium]|jgi:hypothetical protein|nr:hypothetical protein [Phycisphaerae bacterium]
MSNGTNAITITKLLDVNPPVEVGRIGDDLTITFPGSVGDSSGLTVVTLPGPPLQGAAVDISFSGGTVVSLPGEVVGAVEFPGQSEGSQGGFPLPGPGIGLIDLPNGGAIEVNFPGGALQKEKIKVTVKAGIDARLFTESAAM